MARQFLGKNINLFLIIILMISVGSVAVLSTYYGQRYETISENNKLLAERLENESRTLLVTIQELESLRELFNETTLDVERFDVLYSEKDELLSQTSDELTTTKSELEQAKRSLIEVTNRLTEEQARLNTLESQKNTLQSDLAICESDLSRCETRFNECDNACPDWDD
ncbi:MAG: hypothetical protein ACMXYE_01495 [Candidatus Woesearchaeota archaeon]